MAIAGAQTQYTSNASYISGSLQADGTLQRWNTSGTPALEDYTAGNIADYRIAVTEQGASGFYVITVPATLPAGHYRLWLYLTAASETLAQSDLAVPVGLDYAYWNGTAWKSHSTVAAIEDDAITAAALADGAIDAATFAADVDAEILGYLVDDATRIDASALNTAATAVGSDGTGLTEAGGTGDHLTAIPWNAAWDDEVQSEVIDALQETVPDSVPADGTRPSVQQAAYMITQLLTEFAISSTTLTVKKPDGSTTLMTFTLDDATNPTSLTRSG